MKRLGSRLGNKFRRPACRNLPESSAALPLSPHLAAHAGVPQDADSLAYEPVQRLLALGTKDGRLKLLGAYGVEKLLHTHASEATRQLFFLTNRGTLVRLDRSGGLEAWAVDTGHLISRLELAGDRIVTACPLPGEPYIMLGCWSGCLRVACLQDSLGEPTSEAREIKGMHVLEYMVPASQLGASGPVVSCSVSISDEGPLLLAHHAASGVVVWNIRWEKVVLRVNPSLSGDLRSYGSVSSACWANHVYESRFIATGHESGELFVWKIPDKPNGEEENEPEMIHQSRAPPRGVCASRISSLTFVSGPSNGVLAMGGQSSSEPDTLIRFSIPTKDSNSEDLSADDERFSFPWSGHVLGHVLIPPNGSMAEKDDPVAILVLLENGKLMLHNFNAREPVPLHLPFQNVPQTTLTHLATLENDTSAFGKFRSSLTAKPWDESESSGEIANPLCNWVLSGGRAPIPAKSSHSSVFFCGHSDGVMRIWDFSCETPRGLGVACPPDKPDSIGRLSPVSAFAIAANGNFLAVGHEEGKTNVYRFSEKTREIKVQAVNLQQDSVDISVLKCTQDPGHQLILVATVNTGAVTALSISASLNLLAIGDSGGSISVLDLTVPCAKFRFLLGSSPLHSVCFGNSTEADGMVDGDLLFASCLDSSLAIVSMTTGKMTAPSGGWVRPKTPSTSILTVLLDGAGYPIQSRGVPPCNFPWLLEKEHSGSFLSLSSNLNSIHTEEQSHDGEAGKQVDAGTESSESELSESKSSASGDLSAAAVPQADIVSGDAELGKKPAEPAAMTRVGSWAHGRRRRKSKEQPIHKTTVSTPDPKQQVIPEEVESQDDANDGKPESDDNEAGIPSFTSTSSKHTFVLMVTNQFARIYTTDSILQGDRSSMQKLSFPSTILFAALITDPNTHAVGLVTISTTHTVQVYSLPNLDLVEGIQLEDILGWWYHAPEDPETNSSDPCHFSADNMGQLLVQGLFGELFRISLLYGTSQIQMPSSTYDWELAAAAHSARQAALHRTHSNNVEACVNSQDKIGETLKKGFGTFLGVAKKARDEFDKAMHPQQPKPVEDRVAPSLFTLFKVEASRKTSSRPDLSIHPDTEEDDEFVPPAHSEEKPTAREELLAGARVPDNSDGQARVRTADEIREAYGKPRRQKGGSGQVSNVMGENIKKLQARGEKMKKLDDKTSDMADDAANFASLAKQLADQEKNKKWWQL